MKSFIRWLPRLGVGISALVLALALGRSLWLYLDYMGA
jgi:hypothetical protein